MSRSSPGRIRLIDWLVVPPALSLALVVLLFAAGGEGPQAPKGVPVLWGAFFLAYVFLVAGDLLAQMKGTALPVAVTQLLCQGLVLTALPSYLGSSPVWSWIGLALLASGMAAALSKVLQRQRPRPRQADHPKGPLSLPVETLLEAIPLPAFFDGGSEEAAPLVNEAATELAASVDWDTADLFREAAAAEDDFSLGEREFSVFRGQGLPLTLLEEKVPAAASASLEIADDAFDSVIRRMGGREQGLLRVAEELARARRYRRWIAAVLVRPEQVGPIDHSLAETQEQEIFDLFLAQLAAMLRESDPIFRMAPQELLVLLPETPQAGARKFSSRLKQEALEFKPKLFGLEGATGPFLVLKTGVVHFDGNEALTTDALFSRLEASIKQNL